MDSNEIVKKTEYITAFGYFWTRYAYCKILLRHLGNKPCPELRMFEPSEIRKNNGHIFKTTHCELKISKLQ